MSDTELISVFDFIQVYYNRHLSDDEITAITNELKDFSYDEFNKNIKPALLKATSFFTVAELHRIIFKLKKQKDILSRSGKKSWEEFYSN